MKCDIARKNTYTINSILSLLSIAFSTKNVDNVSFAMLFPYRNVSVKFEKLTECSEL
jgi:hypothetical protein